MQLTITTDYAIRIVCFLAYKKENCPASLIASTIQIPNNYIPKIIKKLRSAGLVDSAEGTQGGYYLTREPEDISLWDILSVMETTMKINQCLEEDGCCALNAVSHCTIRKIFVQWQSDMERKLQSITVADLMGKEKEADRGSLYVILQVDLEKGTFKRLYVHNKRIRDEIPADGIYRQFITGYIDDFVYENDKQMVSEGILYERINDNLWNNRQEKTLYYRQFVRRGSGEYVWIELHQYYDSIDNSMILSFKNSKQDSIPMSGVEKEPEEKYTDIEKNYWQMVSFLVEVLDYNRIVAPEYRQTIIHYTEMIYRKLAELYPELQITENEIMNVSRLAPLHDIGKIYVPAEILNKRESLSEDEVEQIKFHTIGGSEMTSRFPGDNTFKKLNQYSYDICRYHHERYDGSGYPDGLKGEEIPLCAQVVGLADTYAGLVSTCTHEKVEHEKAVQMILSGRCGAFSDRMLHSFLAAAMQPDWSKVNAKEKEVDGGL